MDRTRLGRWFMEGYPAKFHAIFWLGIMTFAGPKYRKVNGQMIRGYSEGLYKHELIHFYQAKREGWLTWNIRYYYYLWKVGYMFNPYEQEAYERQSEPMTKEEYQLVGLWNARLMGVFT
jgi:hypothetical protein